MLYPIIDHEDTLAFHALVEAGLPPEQVATAFLIPTLSGYDEHSAILEDLGGLVVDLAFLPGSAEEFIDTLFRKLTDLVGKDRLLSLESLVEGYRRYGLNG